MRRPSDSFSQPAVLRATVAEPSPSGEFSGRPDGSSPYFQAATLVQCDGLLDRSMTRPQTTSEPTTLRLTATAPAQNSH